MQRRRNEGNAAVTSLLPPLPLRSTLPSERHSNCVVIPSCSRSSCPRRIEIALAAAAPGAAAASSLSKEAPRRLPVDRLDSSRLVRASAGLLSLSTSLRTSVDLPPELSLIVAALRLRSSGARHTIRAKGTDRRRKSLTSGRHTSRIDTRAINQLP